MTQKIDLAMGCLVAAVAGDTLGKCTEYLSPRDLISLYGGRVETYQRASRNHPCGHLEANQYTDDSQQLILLAQSLDECNGFNIHNFGKRMGEWAYKCQTIPGYNRFGGGTSMSAGMELYRGKDPLTTGRNRPTCGAGMRTAPVGVYYYDNLLELRKNADLAARITHNNPAAIDSGVLISEIVARLINGENPLSAVSTTIDNIKSDLREPCKYVFEHRHERSLDVAKVVGDSEMVNETVPMALHCFLHTPFNVQETLVNAANLVPGDTDSIACIAGALSGALNGYEAIPSIYTDTLEDIELLKDLGRRLVKR